MRWSQIAVRTLIDNIVWIVAGLFGGAKLVASDVAVRWGAHHEPPAHERDTLDSYLQLTSTCSEIPL